MIGLVATILFLAGMVSTYPVCFKQCSAPKINAIYGGHGKVSWDPNGTMVTVYNESNKVVTCLKPGGKYYIQPIFKKGGKKEKRYALLLTDKGKFISQKQDWKRIEKAQPPTCGEKRRDAYYLPGKVDVPRQKFLAPSNQFNQIRLEISSATGSTGIIKRKNVWLKQCK